MNNINEIIEFIKQEWVQAIAAVGSIIGGLWVFVEFWYKFGDKIGCVPPFTQNTVELKMVIPIRR